MCVGGLVVATVVGVEREHLCCSLKLCFTSDWEGEVARRCLFVFD
jgi:hypothetical protein